MSSPAVNNRQNPLLIQQSNATLQSIQFERKENTEKKPSSLAPLNQKQKGEQNSNLIKINIFFMFLKNSSQKLCDYYNFFFYSLLFAHSS